MLAHRVYNKSLKTITHFSHSTHLRCMQVASAFPFRLHCDAPEKAKTYSHVHFLLQETHNILLFVLIENTEKNKREKNDFQKYLHPLMLWFILVNPLFDFWTRSFLQDGGTAYRCGTKRNSNTCSQHEDRITYDRT